MNKIILLALFSFTARANVVGTDATSFNTITSGLDFVTVQSSETLEAGIVNLGAFYSYSRNTFPHLEDANGRSLDSYDAISVSDLNVGAGLGKNWDMGLSVPMLISQTDNSTSNRLTLANRGPLEYRLNTKYRFFGDRNGGMAVVGSVNFNQIRNNPYTGENAQPTFNLELVGDTTIRRVAFGANIGYRWRTPGKPLTEVPEIDPYDDQIIASLAASVLLTELDTKLIAEVFGAKPVRKENDATDREQSSAEFLLGLKHDFNSSIAGHMGGGTRLAHGVASPDWRAYAGINWTFGPLWGRKETSDFQPIAIPTEGEIPETDASFEPPLLNPFEKDPIAGKEAFRVKDILFEFDSDALVLGGSRTALDQLAEYLVKPPAFKNLVIEGHTDSVGSAAYNKDLSQRRANNIKRYLTTKHKLDPAQITSKGFGEGRPIADNGNYQGRKRNRRVEFIIDR